MSPYSGPLSHVTSLSAVIPAIAPSIKPDKKKFQKFE